MWASQSRDRTADLSSGFQLGRKACVSACGSSLLASPAVSLLLLLQLLRHFSAGGTSCRQSDLGSRCHRNQTPRRVSLEGCLSVCVSSASTSEGGLHLKNSLFTAECFSFWKNNTTQKLSVHLKDNFSSPTMSSQELVATRLQLVYCLAVFMVLSHVQCDTTSTSQKKLLLILVDGCRWDYPDQDPSLKGFKRLEENGVRAPYVSPIFPSNSYPNWYTLVTGLYPESHGFVQNMMYDPVYDDFFLMGPNETASVPHWWDGAEPLWITAEKAGIRSALYWWDGCQVEIRGHKPTFCNKYKYVGNSWTSVDDDVKKEMLTALELLYNNEIQLVQIYYEPVDFNGHRHGPDSEERKAAVKHIDSLLNMLQEKIHAKNLEEQINIVVVSDHGMISTDPKHLNVINIKHHMDVNDIQYMIYSGATSMILPKEGKLQKVYDTLKGINGMKVYLKDEIPEKYHLKNNRLTLPLLLVAKRGYYVQGLDIPGKSIPTGSSISAGSHGYDPFEVPEMRGIFFARGPAFNKGYTSQPLVNTDIYNLLCDALQIEALPNNGSRSRTEGIIMSASTSATLKYQESTAFLLCILIMCAYMMNFLTAF